MALSLSTRSEKVFVLKESDPTGQTTVTIRQASQKAVEALGDLISVVTRERGSDKYQTQFNFAEALALQAFYTIVACDIEDYDNKPLFPSAEVNGRRSLTFKSLNDFRKAWGQLPPEWAQEIHKYILEVNPIWNPDAEEKNESAES